MTCSDRYKYAVQTHLVNIHQLAHKMFHHLEAQDNGLAKLEMKTIMAIIVEVNDLLLTLENIGLQPEEKLILDYTRNYYDRMLGIS